MDRSRATARGQRPKPLSARLLRRLSHWRTGLTTEAGSLGVLVIVAALCLLLGTIFPISDSAPVGLGRVFTPIGFALAVVVLAVGQRLPRWAIHGCVAFVYLVACGLISQSATNGGIMMTSWSLAWMSVYVGIFFSRRAIVLHVSAMTLLLTAAVVVASVPGTLVELAMMTVTMWTAAIALGSLSERLRTQADGDHLTGLLNRHGFAKAASRELALADRTGYPLALALVDLDGFKEVNDEHGHAAGDRLLRDLAQAWEGVLRPGDLLARYGGDEFVVLFPATAEEDARAALQRLREAHDAPWSAGVAQWRRGESLEACVARADGQLYAVKAARGGRRGAVPSAAG
ncbi:GGDEF domain-containing protein [Conexibacter sp. JD483]|uniref:GGDEF domain-containing protein n=1 Tax=unclassified Conexibacter TaxID=2627773 RepID=UPI00271F0750|nr:MULTISPECIES: GGDEF domain-containing protein [unclassified Conexibacter]MDO8186879.1 GGDEF domain-containing protein [Conexibacter sp. CPCC 205706]MDO8200809.1 GGDEF domain-containing protein [Conexibacter sp. CPCC 205762]MDR9369945.1 GGDEF domain-containing protein [Conexibacter sp. JD483]